MLTGERGHYEIACGRDAGPYLSALEKFSQGIGLIPEQIWDSPSLPSKHFRFGGVTGAAMTLLWAPAEYLKLQRSAADGKVFDLLGTPGIRALCARRHGTPVGLWKFNRQVPTVAAGTRLRIQANSAFLLHWTSDERQHASDTRSKSTTVGVEFCDLPTEHKAPIRFTFLWLDDNRWEGKDYTVEVQVRAGNQESCLPRSDMKS